MRLLEQLAALNEEQRAAVTLPIGPALVLAGAGAGKTRVIVARVVHLTDAHGADPRRILAITFAKKSAAEMRKRLVNVLGPAARRMRVLTMHAAALRMLRRRPDMAGLSRGFKVVDDGRTRALAAELLAGGDACRVPDEDLKPIIAALTRLKDAGVTPDDAAVQHWIRARGDDQITPAEVAALRIYPAYQAMLREANEADFADLILWPTLAIEDDGALRHELAGSFDHLLVDEYQDTNTIQARWVAALAREHRSIYCVADDDQTIYSWRGAEVANVLDFNTTWPGAAVARLSVNYRSTPTIVAASDALITHNENRLSKVRRADGIEPGESIQVVSAPTVENEADCVADDVARFLDLDGEATAFVLYRANYLSRAIEEALIERGIAFAVTGDVGFYRRREVLDALAYLRLVGDPTDADAFARIANVPARGLGDGARARIVAAAGEHAGDLFAAARCLADAGRLDRRAAAGVRQLLALADVWAAAAGGPARLGDLLFELLLDAGYLAMLDADPDGKGGDRRTNIDELARVATVAGTVPALTERAARGAAAVVEDARLMLMTIHGSKGLEADRVHLVGWREGVIPSKHALEREERGNPSAVEEERRLAYVALTRARSTVVISHSREGLGSPSRFIAEIPARFREERRASANGAPAGGHDGRPGQIGSPPMPARPNRRLEVPGEGETLPVEAGHRAVADALLSAVEAATSVGRDGSDWTMPWHAVAALPSNPKTGLAYRGSNVLTLWAHAARRGLTGEHAAYYWASRAAWKGLGGELRPSAEPVEILMPVYDEDRSRDHVRGHDRPIGADALDRKVPLLRGFRRWMVFNQADVAGARLPTRGTPSAVERIEAAEAAVRCYLSDDGPALVHGGAFAIYEQRPDRVTMPPPEAFAADRGEPAVLAYYAVLFHEMGHSTGSRSRLHRTSLARYHQDRQTRAAEELVAEIAAAMVGAALGIATTLRADHIDYVASWRSALVDRPEAVMRAVAEAEQAARYILDMQYRRKVRASRSTRTPGSR